MGTLFLSFTIAIGGAIGLVTMSKVFDLETYTTRIFPLIPILYAIIYEVIEKKKTGKAKPIPPSQAKEEMKAGARVLFKNITAGKIISDVAVSFAIKFSLEIFLVALFIYVSEQTFSGVYGNFGIETVGRFLQGRTSMARQPGRPLSPRGARFHHQLSHRHLDREHVTRQGYPRRRDRRRGNYRDYRHDEHADVVQDDRAGSGPDGRLFRVRDPRGVCLGADAAGAALWHVERGCAEGEGRTGAACRNQKIREKAEEKVTCRKKF